eukprot:scaffold93026_cov54-Phaeocystis_antarctica.AAC.1
METPPEATPASRKSPLTSFMSTSAASGSSIIARCVQSHAQASESARLPIDWLSSARWRADHQPRAWPSLATARRPHARSAPPRSAAIRRGASSSINVKPTRPGSTLADQPPPRRPPCVRSASAFMLIVACPGAFSHTDSEDRLPTDVPKDVTVA